MSIVAKPNTFSPSTTISSSQFNANFDTLYNDYNGGISSANLADNAVATAKIAANAVTTNKIADSNVTTSKINDLGVTTAKINTSAVTTAKIANANVTAAKRTEVVKVGIFTAVGNGSLAVTGVGFLPKAILCFSVEPDHLSAAVANAMIGVTDGTTSASAGSRIAEGGDASGSASTTFMGFIPGTGATKGVTLTLASLDADGFTVTVGSYGSTQTDYAYIAFA